MFRAAALAALVAVCGVSARGVVEVVDGNSDGSQQAKQVGDLRSWLGEAKEMAIEDYYAAKADMESQGSSVTALEREIAEHEQTMDGVKSDVQSLHRDLSEVTQESRRSEAEFNEKRGSISDELDSAEADAERMQEERTRIAATISETTEALDSAKLSLEACEDEDLKGEFAKLEAKQGEIAKAVATVKEQVAAGEASNSNLNSKLDTLRNDEALAELKRSRDALEGERDNYEAEARQWREKVDGQYERVKEEAQKAREGLHAKREAAIGAVQAKRDEEVNQLIGGRTRKRMLPGPEEVLLQTNERARLRGRAEPIVTDGDCCANPEQVQSLFATMRQSAQTMVDRLKALCDATASVNAQVAASKSRHSELAGRRAEITAELERIETEEEEAIAALQQAEGELEKARALRQQEIDDLRAALAQKRKEQEALNDAIDTVTADLAGVRAALGEVEGALHQCTSDNAKLAVELEDLKAKLVALEEEKQHAAEQRAALDEAAAKLQEELDSERARLEEETTAIKNVVSDLQGSVAKNKALIAGYKAENAQIAGSSPQLKKIASVEEQQKAREAAGLNAAPGTTTPAAE